MSHKVKKLYSQCGTKPNDRVRLAMHHMYGQEMVTLRVGTKAEPFCVHKNLLTHYSPYFRNAFNGAFKEADEKEITLEDVEPWICKTVMGWLYTQNLAQPVERPAESESESENADPDQTMVEGLVEKPVPVLCFKRIVDKEQRNTLSKHIKDIRGLVKSLKLAISPADDWADIEKLGQLSEKLEVLKGLREWPQLLVQGSGILQTLKSIVDAHEGRIPPAYAEIREYANQLLTRFTKIGEMRDEDNPPDAEQAPWRYYSYSTLVDLYIFADKYDTPQLRMDVLEKINHKNSVCIHFLPDIYAVNKAFENLPSTSGLYNYFYDIYVGQWSGLCTLEGKVFEEAIDLLPKPLLARILARRSADHSLPDWKVSRLPYQRSICHYHEHTSKEDSRPIATAENA